MREIFRLYSAGYSYGGIATELNKRGVEPPRSKRRNGAPPAWMASAIREQLRNPKYVGESAFGVRQFKRHPETRKRKAHEGEQKDRVEVTHPDLAIVPRELWNAVAAQLAEHAANYKKPAPERPVLHK